MTNSLVQKLLSNPLLTAMDRISKIDGFEHAGYMSFMVLFSFFPFIVFFLALTSNFGNSELGLYLVKIIVEHVPESSSKFIVNALEEVAQSPPNNLLTLAIIGNIWTSSSFLEGLRTILNRIYHVNSPPPYFIRRMLSILQFILLTVLLYGVVMFLVIVPATITKVPEIMQVLSGLDPFWQSIRQLLVLFSLFFTVSMFYYMIPNIRLKYYEVLPGSIITVFLWIISGYLLSQYIHHSNLMLIYGSLWNIIITLMFFYIINMLFIYGAALNYIIFRKNK